MEDIILVKNIEKNFKGKKLFCDFSFSVEKNTVHALVGPNGAGKTSLLRILTGIYKCQGHVEVKGSYAMLLENDYLYEDKTGIKDGKILFTREISQLGEDLEDLFIEEGSK